MQLTEEERYQRSKASYERSGWKIVENDIEKHYKICPVIQRACIKEQCLAYTFSRFFNGERDQLCYKCSLLNIILG
jgi:hypothetical protein